MTRPSSYPRRSWNRNLAYQVTKLVRGRPYRYRVESFRDAETGKSRGTWTYLGPADRVASSSPPDLGPRITRGAATRERLLAALETLALQADWSKLTATAIAAAAGVAHGTFYVHFKNKNEALRAAADRVRDAIGSPAVVFAQTLPTRAAERARLRSWLGGILDQPRQMAGVLRALGTIAANDRDVAAQRSKKQALARAEIEAYLVRLQQDGHTTAHPAGTAALVWCSIDSSLRRLALDDQPLDSRERAGLVGAVERAVFGDG